MTLLRKFSIRAQLLIQVSIVLALFAAFAVYYFYTMYNTQTMEIMTNKARSITQILAVNVSAGVMFTDVQTINQTLESAKQDPIIKSAYVFDANDALLAVYSQQGNEQDAQAAQDILSKISDAPYVQDEQHNMILAQADVTSGREKIGRMVLVTSTEKAKNNLAETIRRTALVYLGIFLAAIVMLWFLAKAMLDPIQKTSEMAHRIAEGDLDVESLDESGSDELAKMNTAINVMVGTLREVLDQIKNTNKSVQTTISDIQTSTVQQRHGVEEQATAISEISTTINQLKTTSKQSATIAQRVLEDSERSVEVSKEGLSFNEKVVASMSQIRDQMENIAESIMSLSEKSQQIVDIVATVNDLAQQSNFLALNASIEAAKAGEHGKGFAVVAMEVRNLAEQSQGATAQIRNILGEIQGTMNSAVLVTENGTQKVTDGVGLIQRTGEVIHQLADVVNQGASSARQISASASQQSLGVDQIAQAINSINKSMTEATASAKNLEGAAGGLIEVGNKMSDAIKNYTSLN